MQNFLGTVEIGLVQRYKQTLVKAKNCWIIAIFVLAASEIGGGCSYTRICYDEKTQSVPSICPLWCLAEKLAADIQ